MIFRERKLEHTHTFSNVNRLLPNGRSENRMVPHEGRLQLHKTHCTAEVWPTTRGVPPTHLLTVPALRHTHGASTPREAKRAGVVAHRHTCPSLPKFAAIASFFAGAAWGNLVSTPCPDCNTNCQLPHLGDPNTMSIPGTGPNTLV